MGKKPGLGFVLFISVGLAATGCKHDPSTPPQPSRWPPAGQPITPTSTTGAQSSQRAPTFNNTFVQQQPGPSANGAVFTGQAQPVGFPVNNAGSGVPNTGTMPANYPNVQTPGITPQTPANFQSSPSTQAPAPSSTYPNFPTGGMTQTFPSANVRPNPAPTQMGVQTNTFPAGGGLNTMPVNPPTGSLPPSPPTTIISNSPSPTAGSMMDLSPTPGMGQTMRHDTYPPAAPVGVDMGAPPQPIQVGGEPQIHMPPSPSGL
jgi:hypothetical protein